MKFKALLVISLLFSIFQFVPIVHAAGPTIVQKVPCGTDASVSSVTCTFTGVVSGHWIAIAVGSAQASHVTVSDNQGSTNYTLDKFQGCNTGANCSPGGTFFRATVWHRAGGVSGSLTVTITVGGAASTLGGFGYELSGVGDAISSASGVCPGDPTPCTASVSTSTSVTATGNVVIAAIYNPGLNNDNSVCCTVDRVSGGNSGPVFLSSSTATGSINFDITLQSAPSFWTEAGVVYGPLQVVSTVAPCTFFQLQCWWYPMLFIMLFTGAFLSVAGVKHVKPKGAMHLFLTGLAFGSTVAVIFGIMNIMLPLMLLVVNALFVLRESN